MQRPDDVQVAMIKIEETVFFNNSLYFLYFKEAFICSRKLG